MEGFVWVLYTIFKSIYIFCGITLYTRGFKACVTSKFYVIVEFIFGKWFIQQTGNEQ